MVVNRQASRDFKVTGEALTNSSFYSTLKNQFGNQGVIRFVFILFIFNILGYIYLSSDDLNQLSRDIVHSIKAVEYTTSDYIESNEENSLIRELCENLNEQKVT